MDNEQERYYAYKASEYHRELLKNPMGKKQAISTKQNRNDLCKCLSGRKYKKCCGKPDNRPVCPVCNAKHTNVQLREDPYGKLFNQPLKGTYCNQCYDMLELNANKLIASRDEGISNEEVK